MNNSLKVGAVSGLITGFVFGISTEFFFRIAVSMGLYEPWFRPISPNNVIINVPVGITFGIILGIIYSKVYSLVPRRGIVKGLIYGLIIFFIYTVRIETFDLAYGRYLMVLGSYFTDPFAWLLFGLILGILYDELLYGGQPRVKEEFRIIEYKMRSGLLPGGIAGCIGGLAAGISMVTVTAIGLLPDAPKTLTLEFFLSQAQSHILINMMWGVVFGAIFAKVYSLVPNKGVLKGLCYALIIYLITSFQLGVWGTTWAVYHGASLIAVMMAYGLFVVGSVNMIVYGLVLGALYKK